jgi:surface protein
MNGMFLECSGLTSLDLSSFNTAKVTDMGYMFDFCRNLETIYVGNDWSTAAVTNSSGMFSNCLSIVGGKGTTYDANHVDAEYAHIDGGPSDPGYFSSHVTFLRGDVNGDTHVSIADVTALIDYLLSHDASSINVDAADCNQDTNVSISDVTALIDYLLSGTW